MSRRRAVAAGGFATVALVAGGVAWSRTGADGVGAATGGSAGTPGAAATATAEVTRRDLTEQEEVDGTLGYGDTTDVVLPGGSAGVLTALPVPGTVVDRGQSLVEVDGLPVPLLLGDRPLWRPLGPGAEDGADVEEVERNLVDLGIVTADELTVDRDWTAATTDAVAAWQETLGREETGTIAPGDAVVLPAPVRVVDHPVSLGGPASGAVLSVSGTTRTVSVDLEADRQTLVTAGQHVEIGLPDGTDVAGTVYAVGTVAVAPDAEGDPGAEAGDPTVEVIVALDDTAGIGALDEAPVTVSVVTSAAEGVLAVPVDALLALAEGGFAVERTSGGGTAPELVGVEVGAFADGWVEVTGDLAEGDEVEVPA